MSTDWTQSEAIELCIAIEAICPTFGCHVALTGGLLYKSGIRKDCDLIFYRIRQVPSINVDPMFSALEAIGLKRVKGFGFCIKAVWREKNIDCCFPEEKSGSYGEIAETEKPHFCESCEARADREFEAEEGLRNALEIAGMS